MAEEQKSEGKKQVKHADTNEVFIGNKPFMKYVVATIMQLKEKNSAIVKARGKFISRGVYVAEVAKKRVNENENISLTDEVKIATEVFQNTEGKTINVSTIEITLSK